ncbi:MAG: (d)CMP kinase [Eubacterium sp.]|nr:(d)CMP kinase [Candidatus Colimonas fimequi]
MAEIFRIAIDGPSGAGKSTIAKAVAKELNIDYIDTGAMYRAVGYKVRETGVDVEDEAALNQMLNNTDIDFVQGDIILDGQVINDLIRTPEISMMASKVSAKGPVRAKLVDIQRAMGTRKSIIMDGRDIGTNVLKDAEYKIFLTASAEERADRRFKELTEKGEQVTYEEVLEDIKQRDHNDMTRELNPLCKADDATELDTTGLNIDQVVAAVLEIVRG